MLVPAACAAPEPDSPADVVYLNADVHTADATTPRAQAIAVADGRFLAVGTNAEVRAHIGSSTTVIEADGATVLPGLIDGHVHLESGLSLVRGVNLYGIPDKREWLRLIGERAAELPAGSWIVGGRWDHTLLPGAEFPTRFDLDEVTPEHPVVLGDVDGHSTWANTLALEIAGVTADTPDPMGGEILHDASTGEPTGIFLETANGLVRRHVPPLEGEDRLEALADTFRLANSLGLTGAHNMTGMSSLDDYTELLARDELTLRIWFGATGLDAESAPRAAARRDELAAELQEVTAQRGPTLEFGYSKQMIDGVLSPRTAALLEPYADDTSRRGLPQYEPTEFDERIEAVAAAGFPIAIHAIGDAGVRFSLEALERAQQQLDAPRRPHRLEHIEVINEDDVPRFAALGILASMNPHHCITGIDVYNTDRLGEDRAGWSFAWGKLRDAGATLVFGTDWATARSTRCANSTPPHCVRSQVAGRPEDGTPRTG